MGEPYKVPDYRSEERKSFDASQLPRREMPERIRGGIERRILGVLLGETGQEDFSPSANEVLRRETGNILSARGAITLHEGGDPYGRSFTFEGRNGIMEHPFVPSEGVIRVRKLPFRSFPAKPGDPREVQEKASQGTLPFVYTPVKNMAIAAFSGGQWTKPQIVPVGSIELDPLAGRYGQEIFGGNQVYMLADGRVVMFRPDMHAARFWRNADRMMMPTMSPVELVRIDEEVVLANWDFVPEPGTARIYLAPGLRASANILGVEPNSIYILTCLASPVGAIFAKEPLKLWVDRDFHRAAKGGVGDVKVAGNYGPVLRVTAEVHQRGFDDSLFLDNEDVFIREQRASNSFFVTGGGILCTPPLGHEILDGVTRDSILRVGEELLEEGKLTGVNEGEIPLADLERMSEAFACGTGVTLAPIGSITDQEKDPYEMDVSDGGMGPYTRLIQDRLKEVMTGRRSGPRYEGWLHQIRENRSRRAV